MDPTRSLTNTSNYQIRQRMLEKSVVEPKGFGRDTIQSPETKLQKLPESTHLGMAVNKLGEDHLYRKTIHEEEPRRFSRYQRRNSAVASMLFSSAFTATRLSQNASRTLPSLQLSSALEPMCPLEALRKAKDILDRDTPPPLVRADVSRTGGIKRVTSDESGTDSGDDKPSKRQRTSEAIER
eukprot:CAMPEP_0119003578 /NCGR_PEP_ID=MMETSP1176-20130426/644_1 /TAXON_ID=265551 /ORGANISM="Synedropsis recta cf, Strain CCMP1620" /LENGTH=181 /DNA_ID=CAMNT_0006955193 /DNA_START=103 /DNA_END=648 /DNA_ORIENTATION=+